MFGLAGRTPHPWIETLAPTGSRPVFPDVTGVVPSSTRIMLPSSGSLGVDAAPFRHLLHAGQKRRACGPKLSRDAGAYLCNYGYWRAIEAAGKSGGPKLVVFVHIPQVRMRPRRRGRKSMMSHAATLLPRRRGDPPGILRRLQRVCCRSAISPPPRPRV